MGPYPTDANLDYSDDHPVLLAASSDRAMWRAEGTVLSAGRRIGARLSVFEAHNRIKHQAGTSAIWIELDEDCGGPMDELLGQVARDVADGRYCAVVSATSELVDPLIAAVGNGPIDLLINATDAERAAAFAVALATKDFRGPIADIGSDKNAERLRQLSEEVSRIASTLSRLSTSPIAGPAGFEQPAAEGAPALPADIVRTVIRARRLRARYFAEELFADPAWDMLLDLLQAEIAQLRVPVSSLCIAAAVPATTALRWLKTMVSQGIFVRRADPHDGRRVFVELAPEASQQLRRYFAEVGNAAVI
jgi:DNA-binding MarR family transcriptional regulator